MAKQIICPVCGQPDRVEKVSTIYLTGIGLRRSKGSTDSLQKELQTKFNGASGLYALSRKMAPPAAGKQAFTRPVNPDQAVLAFSLIVPLFLYGIFTSQAGMLPLALGVLAIFYAVYFWRRKKLHARFEKEQVARRKADERIQRGIERWMKLYYCACDDWLFEPGSGKPVPLDQISGYLLQE